MGRYSAKDVNFIQCFDYVFKYVVKRDAEENYIVLYECKPHKEFGHYVEYTGKKMVVCNLADDVLRNLPIETPVLIRDIVENPVLDRVEKNYLSAVIRPFRAMNPTIAKYRDDIGAYLVINIGFDDVILPHFSADTGMYEGMEYVYKYSLEELGIK